MSVSTIASSSRVSGVICDVATVPIVGSYDGSASIACAARVPKTRPSRSELEARRIGAVDAGARGFSCGVEALERGAPVQVGPDTAHEVMRCWRTGMRSLCRLRPCTARKRLMRGSAGQVDVLNVTHVENRRSGIGLGRGSCLLLRWRGLLHRAARVLAASGSAP